MYKEEDGRLIYLVSEHFVSSIINDDRTGLSDQEEQEMDTFPGGCRRHFTSC